MRETCPTHPKRLADITCDRCGTFRCSDCLNLNNLCPECVQRTLTELPSLSTRSLLSQLSMGALGAGYLLLGLSYLLPGGGNGILILRGLIGLGLLLTLMFGVVVFLMWFHLAARRAVALGENIEGSPAYAVGSFFIPFLNLVHPYRVARVLTRTAGHAGALVTGWQATWLISGVLGMLAAVEKDVAALHVVTNLLYAVSLGLCVGVIRQVGLVDQLRPSEDAASGPADSLASASI